MKPLSIFILSCFTALSVFAQNSITVNITLNGNLNREVIIDGKTYLLSDYVKTSTNSKNMITITDLLPGQHTMQVVRNNAGNTRRNAGNEKVFNLRSGYDLDIVVNGNGTMSMTEKRIRNRNRNTGTYNTPMTSTNYNILAQDVRRRGTNSSRITAINTALTNPANYFTTTQVSQLIQMVGGEANRVQLLKTSYRSITDPNNFSNLYSLLSTQASRNNVAAYVSSYTTSTGTSTGTNTGYNTAMSNYNFNVLLTDVRNEMNIESRVNAIYNAFSNAGNYFTAEQARRLIQLITGENYILHLAKASYRSIIDTDNFTRIAGLLSTQTGRNDLAAYVRSYDPNVMYSGSVSGNTSTYRTPMADASFNTMIADIRRQWLPGAKKSAVISVFNTANNYFTTAQAIQLIQLDNDEADRLDMAKASYRTIVDPQNFSQVYNLFNTQAYRDDLAAYIRTNPTTIYTGSTSTTTTYNTAMSDANFNLLIEDVRRQWLPGAKVSTLTNAFNNTANYFTTYQAKQLIPMVSDENNRLHLAKASYRTIVDKENFSQIYEIFTTQAYRDDLAAYVNANR